MCKRLLTGALLLASPALGQEFWLEPARFWVSVGAAVHIRRLIGENFQGNAWGGKSHRVSQFWHGAPGGAISSMPPATAVDTLRTTLTLQQPGTHLVALVTTYAFTTLTAADFAAYLRTAGLEYALAQRVLAGDTIRPVREAYRWCAKTLIQVGPATATDTARTWARPVGLPLELVPEQNPYHLAPGAAFTVRVLVAGRPVGGQQVALWRRGARPRALISKLRSNQNGRVLFRLSEAGEYLVSSVSTEPAPKNSAADWQSTWSTLTFALAGAKKL
jgi:hypothetical protein